MNEKCYNCHERPSKGSLGPLRWCYDCAAAITGHPKRDVRSQALLVEVTDNGRHLFIQRWVPDFIAARYKSASPQGRSR